LHRRSLAAFVAASFLSASLSPHPGNISIEIATKIIMIFVVFLITYFPSIDMDIKHNKAAKERLKSKLKELGIREIFFSLF
jgi:hypothetical protein